MGLIFRIIKRGFIRADAEHSVTELVKQMDTSTKENLIHAKRRVQRNDKHPMNIIDLKFKAKRIPRKLFIYGVAHFITPTIPIRKRCFRCQVFGHVTTQCRATRPSCEFCGGRHDSEECDDPRRGNFCINCSENVISSSSICPVFRFKFELMKERYLKNVSKDEAIEILSRQGIICQVASPKPVGDRIENSMQQDGSENKHPMSPKRTPQHPGGVDDNNQIVETTILEDISTAYTDSQEEMNLKNLALLLADRESTPHEGVGSFPEVGMGEQHMITDGKKGGGSCINLTEQAHTVDKTL